MCGVMVLEGRRGEKEQLDTEDGEAHSQTHSYDALKYQTKGRWLRHEDGRRE